MIINHLQLKGYQKIKLQGSLTAIPWLHDLFQESFKIWPCIFLFWMIQEENQEDKSKADYLFLSSFCYAKSS
jgi:hypothetical protein